MLLVEVIGSLISKIKIDAIRHAKLKIVRLIKPYLSSLGKYSIVEDAIGVGTNEIVLIAKDEVSIAKVLGTENMKTPISFCIIAKVDQIHRK